jgi:glycine reductase
MEGRRAITMGNPLRVVHYINQFFGGLGGEEKANIPVEVHAGAIGPGKALQQILKDQGTVVTTIICGDNYGNEKQEQALAAVVETLNTVRPDVVIAGPAFNAGRYSLACGAVCKAAQSIGIPAVTGMHPESPGILAYKQDVIIVPTSATAAEMQTALTAMARLAVKLAKGEALGPAEVEGYLPRGLRKVGLRDAPGYKRAVDMLVAKLTGQPFTTEIPIQLPERIVPAPAIADLAHATIALVTTGGLVRKGNPDHQVASNATRFFRHSVAELQSLTSEQWEAYHSGYFNHIVNTNPNYILPLSFMRHLEQEGVIGGLYPWIYALPGVSTPVAQSKRMGSEIARELAEAGVTGCLLVAT